MSILQSFEDRKQSLSNFPTVMKPCNTMSTSTRNGNIPSSCFVFLPLGHSLGLPRRLECTDDSSRYTLLVLVLTLLCGRSLSSHCCPRRTGGAAPCSARPCDPVFGGETTWSRPSMRVCCMGSDIVHSTHVLAENARREACKRRGGLLHLHNIRLRIDYLRTVLVLDLRRHFKLALAKRNSEPLLLMMAVILSYNQSTGLKSPVTDFEDSLGQAPPR